MSDAYELDNRALKKLIKTFSGIAPTARVGVLGDKNNRENGSETNATIGAAHEYGTSKLPVRSFLRMPINDDLDAYLKANGAYDKDVIDKMIHEGGIFAWMEKVAMTARQVVLDAFDRGGSTKTKWKPSNMALKDNWQTLVETQQLRNSITSDVKK